MCSDKRQPGNCSKCTQNMFLSARTRQLLPLNCGTVLPVLGQAQHAATARASSHRRSPSPCCSSRRSAGRANRTASASLRAHDAAIEAKSRAAVLGLYSLDQRVAVGDARLAALRRQSRTLRCGTSDDRIMSSRSPGAARGSVERRLAVRLRAALRAGQRRAARDRARRDKPRRGDDEHRQPRPHRRRERGLLHQLQSARDAARRCVDSGSRRGSPLCAAATRAAAATAASLHSARDAAQRLHRIARGAAAADEQPDQRARRGSARSAAAQHERSPQRRSRPSRSTTTPASAAAVLPAHAR